MPFYYSFLWDSISIWLPITSNTRYLNLLLGGDLLSVDDARGGGGALHVGAAGAGQRAVEGGEGGEGVAVEGGVSKRVVQPLQPQTERTEQR